MFNIPEGWEFQDKHCSTILFEGAVMNYLKMLHKLVVSGFIFNWLNIFLLFGTIRMQQTRQRDQIE